MLEHLKLLCRMTYNTKWITHKSQIFAPNPKDTPKFLGHFDLAQTKGGLPFTGKKDSDVHGWMRFKNNQVTFLMLI